MPTKRPASDRFRKSPSSVAAAAAAAETPDLFPQSKKPKPSAPPPSVPGSNASSPNSRRRALPARMLSNGNPLPVAPVNGHSSRSAPQNGNPSSASQKIWTDLDEIALLEGAVMFRERTGAAPKQGTMGSFFDSIKGSLSSHLTQDQVYNKIRRLKSKYLTSGKPGDTPLERHVYELSSKLWGVKEEDDHGEGNEESDDENGDRNDSDLSAPGGGEEEPNDYPLLRSALALYCSKEDPRLPFDFLDAGLKLVGPSKKKVLEEKLREQSRAGLSIHMKRLDLTKELLQMLVGPSAV